MQMVQACLILQCILQMFIVNSGLVWSRNSFVRAGGHFGEDMICRKAVRYYGASCLTYVQCITLSRRDLFAVLNSCPTFRRHTSHIRYCAVLMAFRQMARPVSPPVKETQFTPACCVR